MTETASILADTNRDPAKSVRVSYIISTRNRAKFLAEALRNAREFITPADELIIVDGASTDDTANVVEANRDIVTKFISEPDRGEAHGFNKGILASRGELIKFLTDDDYTYPDAMRQAVSIMESHPEIEAMVCGGESFVFEPQLQKNRFVEYVWLPPDRRQADGLQNVFCHAYCGVGLVLRRRTIAQAGLLDTSYLIVDTEYMARLLTHQLKFVYADIKLFRHIEYDHSGVKRMNERLRDVMRIVKRMERWDMIDHDGRFPEGAVLKEMSRSLDLWPRGGGLSQWLECGERLQRSRLKIVFSLLLRSIQFAFSVNDAIQKPHAPRARVAIEDAATMPAAENVTPVIEPNRLPARVPEWDASVHSLTLHPVA
jgi:GT2 family glycosyltransferase